MSVLDIADLTEESAHSRFKEIVWAANDGAPVCPECGCTDVWDIRKGRRWKCAEKACRAQFSVTSHTIFKDRKLLGHRDIPR